MNLTLETKLYLVFLLSDFHLHLSPRTASQSDPAFSSNGAGAPLPLTDQKAPLLCGLISEGKSHVTDFRSLFFSNLNT